MFEHTYGVNPSQESEKDALIRQIDTSQFDLDETSEGRIVLKNHRDETGKIVQQTIAGWYKPKNPFNAEKEVNGINISVEWSASRTCYVLYLEDENDYKKIQLLIHPDYSRDMFKRAVHFAESGFDIKKINSLLKKEMGREDN